MLASLLIGTAGPALAATPDLSAYMTARVASADGAVDAASRAYARALAGDPDNPLLAIRAYREALASGDDALARRAAGVLARAEVAPADATLFPLADAARQGSAAALDAGIARLDGTPLAVLVPALRGWSAFARGADPIAALGGESKDAITRRFTEEARALLLIATGKTGAGLAIVTAMGGARAPLDLRLGAAQLLIGQGRAAEAQALLPGDDPATVAMRATPARPSAGFGVSRLLARVAADLPTREPSPLAIAFVRASLVADPGYDRARVLMADILARNGAPDEALTMLAAIGPETAFASAAATLRLSILVDEGRADEALAAARTRALAKGARTADIQRYGDLLASADRYADAAAQYVRVVAVPGNAGDWAAWLQYGGALERADRWPEARVALTRAVALGPDEPVALNYLGYAQAQRGEAMAASVQMLERAHALRPEDASITDSLGWVYFLAGNAARALPLVERATVAEPTNAEIGEHLGDIYWSLGRRYEARYAWRAALVTADAVDAARLTARIATGPTASR